MARGPREDHPGALHHVILRCARGTEVFQQEEHRSLLLDHLGPAAVRRRVRVLAWAVLPDSCHLLLQSLSGRLSDFMRDVNGLFTQRLNRRKGRDGPLFSGRFKSQILQGQEQFSLLLAFVHLLPLLRGVSGRPEDSDLTSLSALLGRRPAPACLDRDGALKLAGGVEQLERRLSGFLCGVEAWPQALDLLTGLLKRQNREGEHGQSGARQYCAGRPLLEPLALLALVSRVSGTTREEIMTPRRGPGANPARRLAVVALSNWTMLTQREIGRVLGMSAPLVAKTLERERCSARLSRWLEQMEETISWD